MRHRTASSQGSNLWPSEATSAWMGLSSGHVLVGCFLSTSQPTRAPKVVAPRVSTSGTTEQTRSLAFQMRHHQPQLRPARVPETVAKANLRLSKHLGFSGSPRRVPCLRHCSLLGGRTLQASGAPVGSPELCVALSPCLQQSSPAKGTWPPP